MSNQRGIHRTIATLLATGLASAVLAAGPVGPAMAQTPGGSLTVSQSTDGDNPRTSEWAHENPQTLTREQVLARAKSWTEVTPRLQYDGGGLYQGYRTDCSGFVSMAWGLSTANGGLDTTRYVPMGVAYWIGKEDLAPGDALLNDAAGAAGHVELFEKWADSSHSSFWGYDFTRSGALYRQISYPGSSYRPVRAKNVVDRITVPTSATANQFFHTARQSDGSWTGFGALAGANGATEFKGAEAAIAGMPDGSSQVLGIGLDGNVYHEVRYANGYWSGFQALPGVSAPTMQAHKVAITAMPDGSAQILVVANNNLVYHQTRYADGNWSGFQLIRGVNADTMAARGIAIAGTPDGAAQILAIGDNGLVYHKARYANGTWSEFQLLAGVGWDTMQASQVSITGMADGSAQVLAIGDNGLVYHEARYASGEWSGFQPITGVDALTMRATQIAIAATPDGAAQILAIAPNDLVYHKARYANGTWSNFQLVPGAAGANTFAANTIAITGLPNNSTQILATGH